MSASCLGTSSSLRSVMSGRMAQVPPLFPLLGVRQAALNTVHPQLCVEAVLGAEVVHSFGRLELREDETIGYCMYIY